MDSLPALRQSTKQKVEAEVVGVSESWPTLKRVRSLSLPPSVAESVLLDKRFDEETNITSEEDRKQKEDLVEPKSGDSIVNMSSADSTQPSVAAGAGEDRGNTPEDHRNTLIEEDFSKDVLMSKLTATKHVRRYLRGVRKFCSTLLFLAFIEVSVKTNLSWRTTSSRIAFPFVSP